MKINRKGSASWSGGLKDGKGSISTESGAQANHPYGFAMRFEGVKGTNPEEVIGAAHAGCSTRPPPNTPGRANLTATKMDTTATVTLEQKDGGFAITAIHLELKAQVPGTDQKQFAELAKAAKENCPVSKLMKAEITLDAKLV